jgi:hypothetical protein
MKDGDGVMTTVEAADIDEEDQSRTAAYPGGIVDCVVKLSNGEYEVHNIGVNWPHHVFVNKNFIIGAN